MNKIDRKSKDCIDTFYTIHLLTAVPSFGFSSNLTCFIFLLFLFNSNILIGEFENISLHLIYLTQFEISSPFSSDFFFRKKGLSSNQLIKIN